MKAKKILADLLCISMMLSNVMPAFAATTETDSGTYESTAENISKETEVLYEQSASYFVTIPKIISLGSDKLSTYSVKVEGDIPSDKQVYVSPIDSIGDTEGFDFYMKDQNTKAPKDDVVATVMQSKFYWNFEDVANAYEETNNQVAATELSAGTWKGIFDFEINMHNMTSDRLVLTTDGDVTMAVNSTYQTNAYINGENVNEAVEWISDNENIMVTNGMLETKASAQVGDTAKITVTAENTPSTYSLEDTSENDILSTDFNVTVIDIAFTDEGTGETISSLDVNPEESKTIKASIVPESVEGTVTWSTTATAGLNLTSNGNSVIIKAASDMPTGSTYDVIATYGTYSKILKVNIVSNQTEVPTVPTIEGIGDGETYEPGKTITIKDDEILNINGNKVETTDNTYTFNEEGEYTVSVSNKTGEITITITIQHTHNYVDNICTECGERDPESINYVTLRSDSGNAGTGFLGSTEIIRDEDNVRFLSFVTSSAGHYLSDDNCWDVSDTQDGSILAWYSYESLNDYYSVYIAPKKEGDVIRFPEDSSNLFASINNGNPNSCDISGWSNIDFSKVKNCSGMFRDTELYLMTFDVDTSSVEKMDYMFAYCTHNDSSYDPIILAFSDKVKTPNLKSASNMFYGTQVKSIYNFEALSVIGDEMFPIYSKVEISGFSKDLKSIGERAFSLYRGTSELVVPDSVETIGDYAFNDVAHVTLPCRFNGQTFGARSVTYSHNYEEAVAKEPTCTEAGKKKYTCNNCGYSYTEEMEMLEHDYVETVTRKATCVEVGERKYTCNDCGHSYTEEIKMLEHDYMDGICTNCGKEFILYETAPTEAIGNWNYTLDDVNNIVTLNYYKGSETDVIVYGNYEIGDKTYKTQLASNTEDARYSTKYMFNGYAQTNCNNIKTITFCDAIDTSNVTNMRYMFHQCKSLTKLDVSNFDTSKVTDMSNMFRDCSKVLSIDVSGFDTSNVTDMALMFNGCNSLTSLDVSSFDTSNVTNMSNMFYECSSLRNLDLSSFDTSNVTNMQAMFQDCSALHSLDLTSFNIQNVDTLRAMFYYSRNLSEVLVSRDKWVVKSGCNTSVMFSGCGTSSVTYK